MQELRKKSAVLEQQLARLDEENRERAKVVEELHALQTQVSEDSADRKATEARKVQHAQDVDTAITGLLAMDRQLQTGDTNVGAALSHAEQVLSAHARYHLSAIRTALDNKDIATARAYLEQAIIDTQLAR